MDYSIKANYIGKKCLLIIRDDAYRYNFGTIDSAEDGRYTITIDGYDIPTSNFYRTDFIVVGDVVLTNDNQKGIIQSFDEAFGLVALKTTTGFDISVEAKDINRFLEHRPMQKNTGLVTPAVEFVMEHGYVVDEAPEERKEIGENWFVHKKGEPTISGNFITDVDIMNLAKKLGFSCKFELGGNLNSVGEDMFDQMTGADPTYSQMDYVNNNTLEPNEYKGIEPPTFAKGGEILAKDSAVGQTYYFKDNIDIRGHYRPAGVWKRATVTAKADDGEVTVSIGNDNPFINISDTRTFAPDRKLKLSGKTNAERNFYSKGGNIRLIPKGEEHRFTGGATSKPFAGNFEIKGWKDTAVLYSLDDFDKMWVRDVKLKPNEEIYRYTTQNTLIGGMMPLVKLNKKSGLVYFLTEEGNEKDEPIFATRGIPARFANFRQYAKGGSFEKCPVGTEVQSLLFKKEKFTVAQAKKWAKEHGYKFAKVDSGKADATMHRLRQQPPTSFNKESFRTIHFTDNIEAVIGCPNSKAKKFEDGGGIATATRAELDAWLKECFKNPGKWYFYNKTVDGIVVQMKFYIGVKEVDVQIFRAGEYPVIKGMYLPRNYSTKKDTQAMIKEALDKLFLQKMNGVMADGGDVDDKIGLLAKQLRETTDRQEADHIRSEISYWKDKKAGRKWVVEEDKGNVFMANGGDVDTIQEAMTDLRIAVASALFLNGATKKIDDLIDIREYQNDAPFTALSLIEYAVRTKLLSPDELNAQVVSAAKETVDEYSRLGLQEMGSSDWTFAVKEFLVSAGINAGFRDSKLVRFDKYAAGGDLNFNVYLFSNNKQATASLRSLIGYCLTIAKKNVDRVTLAEQIEFGGSGKYFQFELALRKALEEVKKKYPAIPEGVSIGYVSEDGRSRGRIYANYSIYSIYKSFDADSLIDQKEEVVEEYAAGGDVEKANKLAHVFSVMDYAIVRGITASDKTEEEFDKALNEKFKNRKFPLYATHKAFEVLALQQFADGGEVEKYFRGGEINDYKTFKNALIYLAANSKSRDEFAKKVKSDLGTALTKYFPLTRRDILGVSDQEWIAWSNASDTKKMVAVSWQAVYDKLEEEPTQDISELEATLEVMEELYGDAVKEKNQRAINELEPQMEVIREMLHEADKRKKARTTAPVLKPKVEKVEPVSKLKFELKDNRFGYKDYEVIGHDLINRVTVPDKIKKGDTFNVYYGDSSKTGFEWEGSLEESIKKHEAELQPVAKKTIEKPKPTPVTRSAPRGRGVSSHGIERSHDASVRPSPSISATVYPSGYEMMGNDGNMWKIIVDSRDVHRWKKV